MIEPVDPSTEPLGSSSQRLAGIELQLVRLNAQLRTTTRWMQVRETMAIVSRVIGFGIAIFVALTVSRFLQELKDQTIFGGGSALDDLQNRIRNAPGIEVLLRGQ